MVTFQHVQQAFLNQKCRLLMTEAIFKSQRRSTTEKYPYIASCGHEHSVWFNVFKNRGTGILCPSCVIEKSGEKQRGDISRTIDGQALTTSYEDRAMDYIEEILSDIFDTKRTFEGCLADMVVKPKTVSEDEWLKVQVKSTLKPGRDYGFHCGDRYVDCMIFCVSLSDRRMWLLNGNDIISKKKITMGLRKSKYDINEVNINTIKDVILSYYKLLPSVTFEDADIPIGFRKKTEREYVKIREQRCSFINFSYPLENGLVYDCMVGNYKIQEKVGNIMKNKRGTNFTLHKSCGRGNHNTTSYKPGDNDFYWLHCPDKRYFYVIPEHELLKIGKIGGDKQANIYLNPTNVGKWAFKYLFDYTNLDVEKLTSMFI